MARSYKLFERQLRHDGCIYRNRSAVGIITDMCGRVYVCVNVCVCVCAAKLVAEVQSNIAIGFRESQVALVITYTRFATELL